MSEPTAGMSNDTRAKLAFDAARKSTGLAYVLWFFLGWIGVHRFYLGRTGSGIALLVLSICSVFFSFVVVGVIGFVAILVWLLADAFLIPGMAREYNQSLLTRIESGLGA